MPATLDCFRACSCWGGLYGLLCRHPFSPAECYLGILSHLPLAMAYDFSKGGQIYIYCMIHSPLLGECERGFTPTTHRSFGSGAFRSACSMRYGTLWCMIFLFAVSRPLFLILFRSYLILFRSYLILFRSLLLVMDLCYHVAGTMLESTRFHRLDSGRVLVQHGVAL